MDLPTFGKAHQANIGDQLQFQAIGALFAGATGFMFARRLVGGSGEVLITTAATSAFSNDHSLVGAAEVVNQFAGLFVIHGGAYGHLEDDALAVPAGAVGSFPMTPPFRLVFRVEPEVDQRVVTLAGLHDDVAALAAISTGRTAPGDKFFAAEGHAAVPAVASFHSNSRFIDKHCYLPVYPMGYSLGTSQC